jgi:hypothetical protein
MSTYRSHPPYHNNSQYNQTYSGGQHRSHSGSCSHSGSYGNWSSDRDSNYPSEYNRPRRYSGDYGSDMGRYSGSNPTTYASYNGYGSNYDYGRSYNNLENGYPYSHTPYRPRARRHSTGSYYPESNGFYGRGGGPGGQVEPHYPGTYSGGDRSGVYRDLNHGSRGRDYTSRETGNYVVIVSLAFFSDNNVIS